MCFVWYDVQKNSHPAPTRHSRCSNGLFATQLSKYSLHQVTLTPLNTPPKPRLATCAIPIMQKCNSSLLLFFRSQTHTLPPLDVPDAGTVRLRPRRPCVHSFRSLSPRSTHHPNPAFRRVQSKSCKNATLHSSCFFFFRSQTHTLTTRHPRCSNGLFATQLSKYSLHQVALIPLNTSPKPRLSVFALRIMQKKYATLHSCFFFHS